MKNKGDNFSRRLNATRAFGFLGENESSFHVKKAVEHFDRNNGRQIRNGDCSIIEALQNSL